VIDVRATLKEELAKLTYTDANGVERNVNVILEEELNDGKARWPTPLIVVRGMSMRVAPADIGWNEYKETADITLSLYVKQRATDYVPELVRGELSRKIEAWVQENKEGINGTTYLKLVSVDDRSWVEAVGTLRRDFTLEVYNATWEGS